MHVECLHVGCVCVCMINLHRSCGMPVSGAYVCVCVYVHACVHHVLLSSKCQPDAV